MPRQIADLTVSSPDFENLGALDRRHATEGDDVPPRIVVSGVPSDATELALILHDPDAPLAQGFTHWVVYGIPPVDGEISLEAEGVRQGKNFFGNEEYTGMEPPPGHGQHHYYFWVYALDGTVEGTPNREEFLERHADDIIEQNRLIGTYQR